MPSRQNAARIDPAVWESYRTEIHSYYIGEEKSLGDLISYMREKNNFHATKAQYERQFTLWRFRKKLSSNEWEFVFGRMEKRKREGKENELFVEGFRVPDKRIKKEISRHHWTNETAASEQVQTPEGISVRTPQTHTTSNISLENLPWVKFQKYVESRVSASPAPSLGNSSRRVSPSLGQPGSSTQETEMLPSPRTPVSTSVQPAFGYPGTIAEQELVRNIPSISQLPVAITEGQTSMARHGLVNQHSWLRVVKFTLYLASNDLLSDTLAERFLRLVIDCKKESVLASLFKERMPTIEAFTRFAFKHALYIQDTNILRICIEAGADPNLPLKNADGDLHTPLEVSMYVCGNIELTKLLLDAGAHTNDLSVLTWMRFSSTSLKALVALFDIELVRNLLVLNRDIGATSCWDGAVLTAAAVGNVEPIRTLFRVGVTVQSIKEWGEIALVNAAGNYDIELVQILLQSGVNIGAYNDNPVWRLNTALEVGTWRGHIRLVKILLDAGANVTSHLPSGATALQIAVDQGYSAVVRILLDAGANVNALSRKGRTALQIAAGRGNIGIVRDLLDAGADVDATPTLGGEGTALQAAAAKGNIELVQILLHEGADVNAPPAGEMGFTALQRAAWGGNIELARILIGAGAKVNTPSGQGRTALQAAAEQGNIGMVQALLGAGANVEATSTIVGGGTALHAAAAKGKIGVVRILLHAGANVNAPPAGGSGFTALQHAALGRNIELAKILRDAGANVNAPPVGEDGLTALQAAASKGDIELVQILLHAGASVNAPSAKYGATALQAAVGGGNIEVVRALLNSGANVNAIPSCGKRGTALQDAAERGDIELVRILLVAGADVNARPSLEFGTALHGAVVAIRNSIELARILIDAGADVNAFSGSDEGRTPIQAAVEKGKIELVQALLGAGAGINTPAAAYYGRTALQAAALSGSTEMVQFLLNKNAQVNAPPAHVGGITALQGAAIKGHLAIAILLLQTGADVTAAPAMFMGRSALEGAAENGRLDIAQLLLDASADIQSPSGKNLSKAMMLAERGGHHVVVKLLKDYPN